MTHAIHPTLSVRNHTKSLTSLLITKLEQYPMIFGHPWIKKHAVLLDMIYDSIIFFSRFCMHLGTSLFSISSKPREDTKKILKAKRQ